MWLWHYKNRYVYIISYYIYITETNKLKIELQRRVCDQKKKKTIT